MENTMSKGLAVVKKAVSEVEATQKEYSSFGAWDSEPDWHVHYAMAQALEGETVIPSTAREWELFTASMNCGKAGRAMSKATIKLVKAIQRWAGDKEVRNYVKDHCWRVF